MGARTPRNIRKPVEASPTDLAWAAGIIDGEGTICIFGRQRLRYAFVVRVGNTDPRMIVKLWEMFGGTVSRFKDTRRPNRRMVFNWVVNSVASVSVLEAVLPYLVTKREQAEIGLAFARTKRYQGRSLSESVVAERTRLKDVMGALKSQEQLAWPKEGTQWANA